MSFIAPAIFRLGSHSLNLAKCLDNPLRAGAGIRPALGPRWREGGTSRIRTCIRRLSESSTTRALHLVPILGDRDPATHLEPRLRSPARTVSRAFVPGADSQPQVQTVGRGCGRSTAVERAVRLPHHAERGFCSSERTRTAVEAQTAWSVQTATAHESHALAWVGIARCRSGVQLEVLFQLGC